ncbi:MAG: YbaB/EbfC family nucleoid-associated protein [Alphaproteobacteria bacterium]
MNNFSKMMQQAQQMQKKMQELQAKLEDIVCEGTAGGGLVRVLINGKGHCLKTTISPSLLSPDEHEILEDLTSAAFNDAKSKLEVLIADETSSMMSGMGLPAGLLG